MKAFKGFDKDLKCRGYQFEVGKSYEEGSADLCKTGFHACENPLDVWDYYGPESRFAEVELDDVTDQKKDDSKRVGKKIYIKLELGLKGLITAAIDFLFETNKAGDSSQLAASGDSSQLAASGDRSQLAASGYGSQLAASGYGSQLAASGDRSQLVASGDRSQLAASGDRSQLAASGDSSKLAAAGYGSQLAASGDSSKLAAAGDSSKLAASGDSSKLAAAGDCSQLAASGKNSVVMNTGIDGIAKAAKGCWITLAEWIEKNNKWIPLHVVTRKVDGTKIKADTWYKLVGGKFTEQSK